MLWLLFDEYKPRVSVPILCPRAWFLVHCIVCLLSVAHPSPTRMLRRSLYCFPALGCVVIAAGHPLLACALVSPRVAERRDRCR